MELWPCGCISCWISTYIDHSGCLCLRLTYSYFFLHIAQPQGSVWTWLLAEFWPLFTFFFCPGPANSCVCTGLYACPDTHCSCRANIVPHAEYITGSQLLTKEVSFTLLRAWSATSQRAPRCVCVCVCVCVHIVCDGGLTASSTHTGIFFSSPFYSQWAWVTFAEVWVTRRIFSCFFFSKWLDVSCLCVCVCVCVCEPRRLLDQQKMSFQAH